MALNTLSTPLSRLNNRFVSLPSSSRRPQPKRASPVRATAGYATSSSGSSLATGDSYLTLGVRPGSSKQDIKQAYRKLALKYHPDVCQGEHCAPKFKQINAAYEMLQKAVEAKAYEELEWSDDEDEEIYKSGWEGAWVF